MRRLLILFVLFFFAGSLVHAGWPFSKKTEPRFDAAALQKTLKSLAPTEAEKAAISQFRKDALKQHTLATLAKTENANPIQTVSYNAEVSPSFDPDGPQICTETRFLSADASVVKMIMAEKSLQWSGMPAPLAREKSEKTTTFNACSTVSETQSVPLVRFLDKEHAEAFSNIFMTSAAANLLQAPKITTFSGHTGQISDISEKAYLTGVLSLETRKGEEIEYQPIVQVLGEGMRLTTTATYQENGSCRVKMNVELLKIEDDADSYSIAEGTLIDIDPMDTKGEKVISLPKLTKTTVSIPSIDVPENMSALFALPGTKTANGQGMFLMVTPKRVR